MRSPTHRTFRRPPAPTRRDARTTVIAPTLPPPSAPTAVSPDGDGIRWELVARMKALIAADALDTPDRWAIAEELLFADAEG